MLAAVANEAICSLGRRPAFRPTQTCPFIPPLLDRYRDGSRSNGCGWKTEGMFCHPLACLRRAEGRSLWASRIPPVLVSATRPGCSSKTRLSLLSWHCPKTQTELEAVALLPSRPSDLGGPELSSPPSDVRRGIRTPRWNGSCPHCEPQQAPSQTGPTNPDSRFFSRRSSV